MSRRIFETIRTIIAICVKFDMIIHHIDETWAFLNDVLEGEFYMLQPEAFVSKSQENLVCRLKRYSPLDTGTLL